MEPDADPPPPPEPDDAAADVRPAERWRRTTASGAVTAALALGLQQVFEPERRDTVGIEQEAPANPVDTEQVELRFDPLSSSNTVVVVKPPEEC